ncbi:circadian clock protein KaiA [Cyanobium sp. Morenito 9A2]|uniref:circadian clock protein KaiA n=1 Tax=Cyanobium sp. Morenito 9A2 TaxID=2823718 RepID=UPI0020CEEA62|nr:circadian clock protein KaiA [Cyanobium sp. Morenito 9A2]MCP9849090.1 circadian clock protein KaiA [Cyanobium sp. Morenito 9A2]
MSQPALTIASLLKAPPLLLACGRWLKGGRYELVALGEGADPVVELETRRDGFDAVLLEQGALPAEAYQHLIRQGLRLPAVVVGPVSGRLEYHDAEVHLGPDQLEQLPYSLDAAVSRVLRRGGLGSTGPADGEGVVPPSGWTLTNRLKERLGYLGVFYKRDSTRFLRNLPPDQCTDLLQSLERTYRDLLISYFRDPAAANQALESFVHTAFFSDLPTTKAVEIHMNLIDDFWKQLKLEAHSNSFLQDYRLVLLDVMAHLCEMYRRSIPTDAQQLAPRLELQAAVSSQGVAS